MIDFRKILALSLVLCVSLVVTCTVALAEEESSHSILDSVGGWLSQAVDDTSDWVSQAWDDTTDWVSDTAAGAWICFSLSRIFQDYRY